MIENILFKLSIMLVPGLLAITCHEVSHGYMAWRFGDPTARMLGRLTLNPLKHIDIFGTLMLVIVGIGWAKPVPVVIENLRNPKKDMIWVSAAGPITNLILAIVSAGLVTTLACGSCWKCQFSCATAQLHG
jgi:Zn-dependent protease